MDGKGADPADLGEMQTIKPTVISLKTQLLSKGMTREEIASGEHSIYTVHCYAPSQGEPHGLHAHLDEEHMFVVLHGVAHFSSIDGELPPLEKNTAIYLPKGCFYEFVNHGPEPLVVLRFGASEKLLRRGEGRRLTPAGDPIPGRSKMHPHLNAIEVIEGKFFE